MTPRPLPTASATVRSLRRIVTAMALGLSLAGCKPPPPPPPPPAPKPAPKPPTFAETVDTIFAAYFAAHPVTATALGEHAFDAQWPDLSPDGLAAERTRIDAARTALGGTAVASVDEEVDAEIVLADLDAQSFTMDVEQPWLNNPYWYTALIGAGIDELISREFAPADERAASLTARLVALPALVEQAKANLDPAACMLPHTQVAISQLDGLVTLIRGTALERLSSASEAARGQLGAATSPAVMAVRDLQQHLRNTVMPQAAGPWRLGAENFERKLSLTLGTEVRAKDLRRAAVMEHGRVRAQMAALSAELGETVLGSRTLRRIRRRASGNPDDAVTRAVLEALSEFHVQPTSLRDAVEYNLQRLTEFVSARGVVPMDDAEVLEVIWTPPHQRGVAIAGLAAPGPLEATKEGLPSFYLVQPLPASWTPEVSESFLREYNNFMLEILSIHEAIPGHFVQLYYGKREPSKVRRVLQNGAFVEGWAVYTEAVMVDAGYAGQGPNADSERPDAISRGIWAVLIDPDLRAKAIALHGMKFYLRTVTNAILDNSIHAGSMTREEALDLMMQRSFQQEGEAVGKWTRAQLSSTQLSTYFAGASAWKKLRAQAEARAATSGAPFSMSAFHADALSHGAPPVAALPRLMGWTAPVNAAAEPANAAAPPEEPAAQDTPTPEAPVPDAPAAETPADNSATQDDMDDALSDILGD